MHSRLLSTIHFLDYTHQYALLLIFLVLYIIPKMKLQIVVDTSVLIAALRSNKGASFKLLSLVGVHTTFETNISVPLLLEYEEVAKRHQDIHRLSDSDICSILDYLCHASNKRSIYFLWRPFLKDPKDDMVLELAAEVPCHYIVTFNVKDFRDCEQFGVQARTPKQFLQTIGEFS